MLPKISMQRLFHSGVGPTTNVKIVGGEVRLWNILVWPIANLVKLALTPFQFPNNMLLVPKPISTVHVKYSDFNNEPLDTTFAQAHILACHFDHQTRAP